MAYEIKHHCGHDPYNSATRYAPPVRMRTDDPLVSQIRAALDARKLGYSSERTLDLMRRRGFGIEAVELALPQSPPPAAEARK